jgi:hypothetical protein
VCLQDLGQRGGLGRVEDGFGIAVEGVVDVGALQARAGASGKKRRPPAKSSRSTLTLVPTIQTKGSEKKTAPTSSSA